MSVYNKVFFGCLLLISLLVTTPGTAVSAGTALNTLLLLDKAGLAVSDETGLQWKKDEQIGLIPASTTKLVTSWLALRHWGENHRFGTPVYLDRSTATLWIKAVGDPFLVSEELVLMAQSIAALDILKIDRIALDVSLFEPDLVVPGATLTPNPYDAIPSAIACNFNTLNLKKVGDKIVSAEEQTPLTPYSRSFAPSVTGQSLRINTGPNSMNAERYFAELLAELLRLTGITVATEIYWGNFPAVVPDFVHYNSRTLGDIIQLMLKYSTNFIANQLVLTLVAEHYQRPANFTLVQNFMNERLEDTFDWQQFHFDEGAGLSTRNRISPKQLLELLLALQPSMHLLPEIESGVLAKTGSLSNVDTLAGYLHVPNQSIRRFAIMINQSAPARLAINAAIELVDQ